MYSPCLLMLCSDALETSVVETSSDDVGVQPFRTSVHFSKVFGECGQLGSCLYHCCGFIIVKDLLRSGSRLFMVMVSVNNFFVYRGLN